MSEDKVEERSTVVVGPLSVTPLYRSSGDAPVWWDGGSWNQLAAVGAGGGGTVTSITAAAPLTGGTITTAGTIGLGTVPVANGGTGATSLPITGGPSSLGINSTFLLAQGSSPVAPAASANGTIGSWQATGGPGIACQSNGGPGYVEFWRNDGTSAAPTGVVSGDLLGYIGAGGYYGGATPSWAAAGRVRMNLTAAETWSNTAQGAYISWVTTQPTTTATAEKMRLGQGLMVGGTTDTGVVGTVTVGTPTAAASPAAGDINAQRVLVNGVPVGAGGGAPGGAAGNAQYYLNATTFGGSTGLVLSATSITGANVSIGATPGTGDVYYRAAGGALTQLPIGTAGQVLQVVTGLPSWQTVATGGGTVQSGTGPQLAQYAAGTSTVVAGATLSGDATIAQGGALTLATVNSNVGTFQGLTVNAKGLVTAGVNQNYAPLAGATFTGKVTTLASAAANAGLNLPQGAAPTTPVNGDLWTTAAGLYAQIGGATVGPFGTGLFSGSVTNNQLVVGTGAHSLGALVAGTTTTLLHGNAAGVPTWGAVTLTTDVTGTLPIANGGTAASTLPLNAAGSYGITSNLLQTNGTVVSPLVTTTGTTQGVIGSWTPNGLAVVAATGATGTGIAASYQLATSRGTIAAPTAVQSNDALGFFAFDGYGATAWNAASRAQFMAVAAENWTGTAQGTRFVFQTTQPTTLTTQERARIGMGLVVASPTGGDLGAGTINVATGFYVNGVAVTSGGADTVTGGITAAGTTQATGTALTTQFNVVTTTAAGTGVVLPTGTVGAHCLVRNSGANPLAVYPASGAAINAQAVNTSINVVANSTAYFECQSATQWFSVP